MATFAKKNQVTYNNFISHQSFDNMHIEISLRIQCTCLKSNGLNPSFNPSMAPNTVTLQIVDLQCFIKVSQT